MCRCCVFSLLRNDIAREKETHDLAAADALLLLFGREREREKRFSRSFFFCFSFFSFFLVEREREFTGKPLIRRLRFIFIAPEGKLKIRREKKLPLWTVFLHIYRTACLSTHTHSNLFKRYGYVFVSGEENTVGRVLTVALARFDSRRARSKRRFCASLLFFLFPSAAKVIFLPPPLVAGGNAARF